VLPSQLAECVYREAAPGSILLQVINSESRIAGYGEGEHFHAMREGCNGPVLFMRRARSRDKPHLIEPGLFAALLRDDQVGDVNRVKRASESADAHPFLPPHAACSRKQPCWQK
jgi:hypothetical protein